LLKVYRKYPFPQWYDLFLTCHTHGWINLAPFSWDAKLSRLEIVLLIDGQAVDVSIHQDERSIEATICSEKKVTQNNLKIIDAKLARILGLKEDTAELFETALKIGGPYPELIRKGAGRLLRGATFWEDAAKTLFTTNCSWALTQKMCKKICSSIFSIPSPSGKYPFPHPSSLAEDNPYSLKKKMPIGYRAEYLKQLSESFTRDFNLANLEEKSMSYNEAYEKVAQLKGFGPYARTHLLILAGYFDKIPIDSEISRYVLKNYKCRDVERFVYKRFAPWGRYRWWGLKFEKILRRQNWLGD
jgi:3-methyladenine DNA glycosylase/8-oxoguanine DNA glycosylase